MFWWEKPLHVESGMYALKVFESSFCKLGNQYNLENPWKAEKWIENVKKEDPWLVV